MWVLCLLFPLPTEEEGLKTIGLVDIDRSGTVILNITNLEYGFSKLQLFFIFSKHKYTLKNESEENVPLAAFTK